VIISDLKTRNVKSHPPARKTVTVLGIFGLGQWAASLAEKRRRRRFRFLLGRNTAPTCLPRCSMRETGKMGVIPGAPADLMCRRSRPRAKTVDRPRDIWAFGVVFVVRDVTGKNCFTEIRAAEIMASALKEEY